MAVSEFNMAEFKMAAIIKLSQNEWMNLFLCKMAESRMAEFKMAALIKLNENEWVKFFVQNGWIQDGCHHQVNQIELFWVRVRVEWECLWVNLREDNKVSESKMAVSESNMAEFKMAAIIKLSHNEWLKFFLCKMAESRIGRIQDGCHHQVEWEWIGEVLSVQNGWIQGGRIHNTCNHQVRWEWMSLSQIELVWVRVRVEWECFLSESERR